MKAVSSDAGYAHGETTCGAVDEATEEQQRQAARFRRPEAGRDLQCSTRDVEERGQNQFAAAADRVGDAEHDRRANQGTRDAAARYQTLQEARARDGAAPAHASVLCGLQLRQHITRGADVPAEEETAEGRHAKNACHGRP